MKPTILLVNDELQIRNSGKQTLELVGHTVVDCDSGERALKLIARDCGVLITDVRGRICLDGTGLGDRS